MQALRIWPITSAVEEEFALENVNCDDYMYNESNHRETL